MHHAARLLRVTRALRRSSSRTAVLACFALLAPAATYAAPIAGRLGSPSDFVPALTVHAWSAAERRLYSVGTTAGQASFLLEVPPGRYVVFATPADPGAPPVYGAHTRYSLCARDASSVASGACRDHSLAEIEVANRRVDGVDLTDWYLDDAVIAQLDAILGLAPDAVAEAPLAAPKFSEYPAARLASVPRADALQPDVDPRAERDRATLLAALGGEPTFAGRFAIVRVPCTGESAGASSAPCEGAAILDLSLGRVSYPDALNPLPASGACSHALQYRRDSRLLMRTAPDADQLVTRYFVWDGESALLRRVATLATARPERCSAPAVPAGIPR